MSFDGIKITNEDASAHTGERKNRSGYDKNENCKRKMSDNNKSPKENASKQKENASKNSGKQTETHAEIKVISSYLNNLSLIPPPIGKNSFEKLVTDKLSHTNCAGWKRVCCRS